MPVLAARLQPRGGNVIGVQLDNEIGMLAWVSNSPDLTDDLLPTCALVRGAPRRPRSRTRSPWTSAGWADAVRSPDEEWAAALRVDLGRFMRDRFAAYVARPARDGRGARHRATSRSLINIHGTEGGNGVPFAIGVSQLVETYAGVPGHGRRAPTTTWGR